MAFRTFSYSPAHQAKKRYGTSLSHDTDRQWWKADKQWRTPEVRKRQVAVDTHTIVFTVINLQTSLYVRCCSLRVTSNRRESITVVLHGIVGRQSTNPSTDCRPTAGDCRPTVGWPSVDSLDSRPTACRSTVGPIDRLTVGRQVGRPIVRLSTDRVLKYIWANNPSQGYVKCTPVINYYYSTGTLEVVHFFLRIFTYLLTFVWAHSERPYYSTVFWTRLSGPITANEGAKDRPLFKTRATARMSCGWWLQGGP